VKLSSSASTRCSSTMRMPGLTGSRLAVLRRFAEPPALVFVSAYDTTAERALAVRRSTICASRSAGGGSTRRSRAWTTPWRAGPRRRAGRRRRDRGRQPARRGTRLVARDSVLYLQAARLRPLITDEVGSCAARRCPSSSAGSLRTLPARPSPVRGEPAPGSRAAAPARRTATLAFPRSRDPDRPAPPGRASAGAALVSWSARRRTPRDEIAEDRARQSTRRLRPRAARADARQPDRFGALIGRCRSCSCSRLRCAGPTSPASRSPTGS